MPECAGAGHALSGVDFTLSGAGAGHTLSGVDFTLSGLSGEGGVRQPTGEAQVLNIAAYRFVAIDDCAALRDQLLGRCCALDLRGTILLAPEGLNLFLAGAPARIAAWLAALLEDARFHGLALRRSWSAEQPFAKMQVKLKAEIIRMRRPELVPAAGRARAVAPATLARWIDQGRDEEGRPLLLLDTRNAFEVDYGSFRGAMSLGLGRFSDFPARIAPYLDALRDKTVVSFCTGGIRCEKAALFLGSAGLVHNYQLDGGILGYLESVGAQHYNGTCFVFDGREALDHRLAPISKPMARSTGLLPQESARSTGLLPQEAARSPV